MTDIDRLLAALSSSPGDVACRLALADALEEAGEGDRAELTRLSAGLMAAPCGEDWRGWLKAHGVALERQRGLLAAGVRPCGPAVVNSIGMRFAMIPPGTFWMGSQDDEAVQYPADGPRHEVEISRPFYLGVCAVTQGEYVRVMGTNPSEFKLGDRHPVEEVSWEEAVAFCERLSGLAEEKAAKRVYRLPTEAEWEYSCRGPGGSHQPFNLGSSLSTNQANFHGNYPFGGAPKGEYRERTVPVDEFAANGWGLYQMHGNVLEWCSDWLDEGYYETSPKRDPQGPSEGIERVVRGGSWSGEGQDCRSAYRDSGLPPSRVNDLGFRVALVSSE